MKKIYYKKLMKKKTNELCKKNSYEKLIFT